MKQRKPLNIGDKVKFFGAAVLWYSDNQWTLQASDDYCDVLALMDKDYVSILINGTKRGIHRRQVYAVKRKKKAVKVISDERFFVNRYELNGHANSAVWDSLETAQSNIPHAKNKLIETLELGIVARYKGGEK